MGRRRPNPARVFSVKIACPEFIGHRLAKSAPVKSQQQKRQSPLPNCGARLMARCANRNRNNPRNRNNNRGFRCVCSKPFPHGRETARHHGMTGRRQRERRRSSRFPGHSPLPQGNGQISKSPAWPGRILRKAGQGQPLSIFTWPKPPHLRNPIIRVICDSDCCASNQAARR
jgi:hypothetical protein